MQKEGQRQNKEKARHDKAPKHNHKKRQDNARQHEKRQHKTTTRQHKTIQPTVDKTREDKTAQNHRK
jgi:hypothetical protein